MKTAITCVLALVAAAGMASAQSPAAETSVTVGGKTLTIKYSAPSVRGRDIFGPTGKISTDSTYPVWRAGANNATALHTDADLDIGGLSVPKGDYTLFINLKDPSAWQLIVNKQTGQGGLDYDATQDLGRVKMTMSKPPQLVEVMKISLTETGHNKVKLELAWEHHAASVAVTIK